MNAGVSIRPCSVLSRPERALVLLSVAFTSNIGGTLEMIAQLASNQSFRLREDSLWRLFYWALLALVFAGAIWQRFRLPLDPIADPDTWGYLSPALRKLTGAEFGHTNGRNFAYPGFLFLLLRLFADFRAITITQHFLWLCFWYCRQSLPCLGGVVGRGKRFGFLSGSSLAPPSFCCRNTFSVAMMK